jgi:thiol-disulfide isomerase/thioredoxin
MSDTDVRPEAASSPEPEGAVVGARPTRVAPFVALAVALVLGGLFVILALNNPGRPDVAEPYLLNRPAPRVVSTTLDGDTFDLSRRKGSWVVINFFDPTCVPCVQEHPQLIELFQQQLTITDGAELYTIVNRGSDESVRTFFDENGGDWPVVRDPDGLFEHIGAAGAVFMGDHTPEAAGDYLAGPSHVLPTGGAVRFSSPLGVYDFTVRSSVIRYDARSLRAHADAIASFARLEGLEAHARAVEVRTGREGT